MSLPPPPPSPRSPPRAASLDAAASLKIEVGETAMEDKQKDIQMDQVPSRDVGENDPLDMRHESGPEDLTQKSMQQPAIITADQNKDDEEEEISVNE